MPVETRQLGGDTDISKVAALLWMLLGDPDVEDSSVASRTLAECGVDAGSVLDLWAAVFEEFGECSLEPAIEPGALDPDMTITTAATTMANLLARGDDGH